MTAVCFYTKGSRIMGFTVKGHSGYAEEGEDIVCAAITSAVRLAETTINDVFGLSASVKVGNDSVSLRLPGRLSEESEYACQGVLTGVMLYFTELRDEYPDHIEVMEAETQP